MRRCVMTHIRAPARARNQTGSKCCLIPRLQMRKAEYRMTRASTATHSLDWGMRVPATTNFSLCLAICQKFVLSRQQHQSPGRARFPEDRAPLRRYPVGQRVGMKIDMITQTVPRTIWLGRLRDAVLFTCGKVVPRIVASDGEKCPAGAFQMLH